VILNAFSSVSNAPYLNRTQRVSDLAYGLPGGSWKIMAVESMPRGRRAEARSSPYSDLFPRSRSTLEREERQCTDTHVMYIHTILVVEDEDQSRQVLMQILELEGFKAVGASNGVEAMEYLHNSDPPCLIILDLLMPVMNGRQFLAAFLPVAELTTIPVVVVSAVDSSAVSDLGVVRAFRKPLDIDALVRTVRENC
jgi:CheY-like chemotaxis protein